MPDLGKYAAEVLAAYGVSVTLLVLIIGDQLAAGCGCQTCVRAG